MWATNEQLLLQMLNEFLSHSVVKKSADGALKFTVEPTMLANFVESKIPK